MEIQKKTRRLYTGKWAGLTTKTVAILSNQPYYKVSKILKELHPKTLEEVGDLIFSLRKKVEQEVEDYLNLVIGV